MGLDIVELFLEVEKRFDIKIPDEEADTLLTVGHLHRAIMARAPLARRVPDAGRILKLDDGPIPLRSMTPDEVWEALVNVVEQETGVKRAEIQPDARWVQDLKLD